MSEKSEKSEKINLIPACDAPIPACDSPIPACEFGAEYEQSDSSSNPKISINITPIDTTVKKPYIKKKFVNPDASATGAMGATGESSSNPKISINVTPINSGALPTGATGAGTGATGASLFGNFLNKISSSMPARTVTTVVPQGNDPNIAQDAFNTIADVVSAAGVIAIGGKNHRANRRTNYLKKRSKTRNKTRKK